MDRKAAARQYKETRQPMGVYCVRNTVSGKLLVGASINLPGILNRQRSSLTFAGHTNKELQADWNRLGPDAFAFEVLDTLEPPKDDPTYDPTDDLKALEEMWLDKLSPYGERGYNRRK